jgi:tripartite-type tricarboxylate transporter receptor subunit TctC
MVSTYGSPAAGSMLHFTGVMLARAGGFQFTHVAYRGGLSALQDLLAGRVAATIEVFGGVLPHLQSGSLRALVTTGVQRSALLPDVPTIREAGYPSLEATEWFGIFVPAKTPINVVEKLNGVIRDALKSNEIKDSLTKLYFQITVRSPSDFAELLKSDFDRWGAIVRSSGFVPED